MSARLELSALHLGSGGSVVAEFVGSGFGWAEFEIDRTGAIPVASPKQPPRCSSCGVDLSGDLFDHGALFNHRFETAEDVRAVVNEVLEFQDRMVGVIAASVPGLRLLADGLRNRLGMYLNTYHYASVSALVEGRLSGYVEADLFWSFGRWSSRDLACAGSKIGWPSQIVEAAAPEWRDRPRARGVGFIDLTKEESDAATDLLLTTLRRFCDFADDWAAEPEHLVADTTHDL